MVHVYTGDGKGKTTAATGLAVRSAGAGKKVLFFQFLKESCSNELKILSEIQEITVVRVDERIPFLFNATADDISKLKELYRERMNYIISVAGEYDVFILDEAVCAIDENLIDIEKILVLKDYGELVLTGRGDLKKLEEYADYITVMKKVKHPFDMGCIAREGIEY